MLLKPGVSLYNLRNPMRWALVRIDRAYKSLFGFSTCPTCGQRVEPVLTSTDADTHGLSSLHYTGRAVDIRNPKPEDVAKFINNLREELDSDYDIVKEETHVHIEHDPK